MTFLGKPPLKYTWQSDGSDLSYKTVRCNNIGKITDKVTVIDSNGKSASAECAANCIEPFTFDLKYNGVGLGIIGGSDIIDTSKNKELRFTVLPSGGTPPYSFDWKLERVDTLENTGCSPMSGNIVNEEFKINGCDKVGFYRLIVNGKDSTTPNLQYSQSKSLIVLNQRPTVNLEVSKQIPAFCGNDIQVTATAKDIDGGISDLKIKFKGLEIKTCPFSPPQEESSCKSTVSLQGLADGKYAIAAQATDSDGETSTTAGDIIRKCPPSNLKVVCNKGHDVLIPPNENVVAISAEAFDNNGPVTFSWETPGGIKKDEIQWSPTKKEVSVQYPNPQSLIQAVYNVKVIVKDNVGSASDTCNVVQGTYGCGESIGARSCWYNKILVKCIKSFETSSYIQCGTCTTGCTFDNAVVSCNIGSDPNEYRNC